MSGHLPPPSIFELGDSEAGDHYGDEDSCCLEDAGEEKKYKRERANQLDVERGLAWKEEKETKEGENQSREKQESDSETEIRIATPKLDTPTTTPTAEKFNPIDFLTRSSPSARGPSARRHHPAYPNFHPYGPEIREEGDFSLNFSPSNPGPGGAATATTTTTAPNNYLELPSPSKYAADLESERSSLTPDHKREDSVYFTAAWASPKETPSSVKSEPSFSPDRDRLSPVRGVFNGQQRRNDDGTAATAGKESLTPPIDPVSAADADLFVTRLRESIWKSVGKNKKNKTVRDFTQDWLSQFLTGVPRTERNNWLSDDESSTHHSVKGEESADCEEGDSAGDLLGIDDYSDEERQQEDDDDNDRDDGTSTTLSYKTALNRNNNNTNDSQSDWLGLEDEESVGGDFDLGLDLDVDTRQLSRGVEFDLDPNTPRALTFGHHEREGEEGDEKVHDTGDEESGDATLLDPERTYFNSRRSTVTLRQEDFLGLGTSSEENKDSANIEEAEPQQLSQVQEASNMASAQVDTAGHDDLGIGRALKLTEPTIVRERSVSPRPRSRRTSVSADKPLPPPPPPPKEEEETKTSQEPAAEAPTAVVTSPPVPPKPTPVEIKVQPAPENAKPQTTANTSPTSSAPFTRPRKRVQWRKRACIIALPIDDQRTDLLSPSQVEQRLAEFEKQGFSIRGWDGPETIDGDGRTIFASLSRPIFPDPTECANQWKEVKEALKSGNPTHKLPVQFPDQRVWDAYVLELQEAKLRALGVDLGGPPEPPSMPGDSSPMINGNGFQNMPLSLAGAQPFIPAITPPLPTGSATSNPAGAFGFPNPFTAPYAPTPVGGKNPSLTAANGAPSFGIPGTAPTSAPHHPHQHAGLPFDHMLNGTAHPFIPYTPTTPLGQHPGFGMKQPNGMSHLNGFMPENAAEPLSAGGLSMAGAFPPHLAGLQAYGLPFNNGLQQQQSYFPAQQPPPQQQQPQLQSHHHEQSTGPDDGPSDEIEINVNGVPEVELAQPLPSRHGHNVSDTLQKGVEETEFMRHHQQHQEHLGDYIPENEILHGDDGTQHGLHMGSYDSQRNQNGFENRVASDIDTNPSINGDIPPGTVAHHLPGQESKGSLSGYGVDGDAYDPVTGTYTLNNDQIYAPNGYSHQGDGSQNLAPFSPPFSPGSNRPNNPEEYSPTGPASRAVPWNSNFGFRTASFNVEAPAFNPGGNGNALGVNGFANGEGEPMFQPPPRRKSKAIPIRKPDEVKEDIPPVPPMPFTKSDETHTRERENIRDSGVEINGVNVLEDHDFEEQKETHDGHTRAQPLSEIANPSSKNYGSPVTNDQPNADGKENVPPAKPSTEASKDRQKKPGLKPTAKPFEFHPTAPVFEAKPAAAKPTLPATASVKPAHVTTNNDEANSTDTDDIDAVMRQFHGDGEDDGIERARSAEPKEQEPAARGRAQFASPLLSSRDPTESRSPATTTLKISEGTSRATSLAPAPARLEDEKSANGVVQNLNNPGHQRHISDYSDAIHHEDEDKLHARTKYFDTHINDLIGQIIDSKLTPLGCTLETIQQAVNMIAIQRAHERALPLSRPTSHGRSLSIDVEHSDADDEDDENNTSQLRSRSPISRKEARKADKIKQAVLEALAAHREAQEKEKEKIAENPSEAPAVPQPPPIDLSEVYAALAELRELASKKPEPVELQPGDQLQSIDFRKVIAEALSEHAAIKEQERPQTSDSTRVVEEQLSAQLQSLKEMLRESDERAEKEMRMRKDAQDSLAECQHYLKFAENDGNRQRELAERYEAELKELKETRLPEAERLAKECTQLREDQRNVQWTLSELSEKNITLVGRLDEFTVTNDQLKAQNEKAKSENHELRQTIGTLKTQLEERVQARLDLRNKYDKLQADMVAASQELARERAAWKAREEELSLGNATLKMMYEHEVKAREQVEIKLREMESLKAALERETRLRHKLESDITDWEQQSKEGAKFRVMLGQTQRENGHLNDLITQLRHETHASQKDIARLSREKDTIQSRCDRLTNELEDTRENYKSEVERLSRQLHDIKAKAWVDTEQLQLNLSDAKASSKAEMERMYQEMDDLETRRQEEVERLGAELTDTQKKSRSAIDRLQYELRVVNKSKEEEIKRLRVELEESNAARRRDNERREQQLNAMFTRDRAQIDALKQDLSASESLRRIDIQVMQREMNELSILKAQQKEQMDLQTEELQRLRTELDEARQNKISPETLESFNTQLTQLKSQHEEELEAVRSELQSVREENDIAQARFAIELEAAREAQAMALDDATEAHEAALARERLAHEKTLNDLRERHARALHNIAEDRQRHEVHLAEMTQLREEKFAHLQEKNDHLQDKVQHLQEKLEIAKAAAQAAAQAAQSARSGGVSPAPMIELSGPTQPQPSMSFVKGTDEPEKISPQALRESIMVLQDQLQQREQRIEELETQVSEVDKEAPNKLKEKDTEINWLRELLGVRLDDLQDIIATLSLENFDATAVRDAAIRLKANLEMEQQERERATNGKTFPSLESITSLAANSRSLPLVAAAAWGNWRKSRQSSESNDDSNSSQTTSTPSKAASTAQSFFSGLLTPPSTIPRRGRSTTPLRATSATSTSRKTRTLSNSSSESTAPNSAQLSPSGAEPAPPVVVEEDQDMMATSDERPRTPLLFKNSSYDHDAPSANLGEEILRLEAEMREDDTDSVVDGPTTSHQDHSQALTPRDDAFAPSTP